MITINYSHIFVTVLALVLIVLGVFIEPGFGLLWLIAVVMLVATVHDIYRVNSGDR